MISVEGKSKQELQCFRMKGRRELGQCLERQVGKQAGKIKSMLTFVRKASLQLVQLKKKKKFIVKADLTSFNI